MNVHLIGPFPPPYGGVSTHISRLRKRLLRDGHQCTVWSKHHRPEEKLFALGHFRKAWRQLSRLPSDAILHFHQHHLLAGILAATGRKVIFTVHNERINHALRGGQSLSERLLRFLGRTAFRRVRRIITVSESAKRELVHLGIDSEVIRILSAYLKPEEGEQPHPQNILEFKAFRNRFPVLMTANAWALKSFKGEDLYGIDLCIEALSRLHKDHPTLGLVLALPLGRGTEYLQQMQDKAVNLGVSERILWLLEPGAYHPLLRKCDLFLRPTNTDGFSISIAEAMEFGIPVIASDAVKRPSGCVLFESRNAKDLAGKIHYALDHLPELGRQSLTSREADRFDQILYQYQDLLLAKNASSAGSIHADG